MTRVVVDASALAAIVFGEPDGPTMARTLDGAEVHAPSLLKFELANTAWKKVRQTTSNAPAIIRALDLALSGRFEIAWHDVDCADVVLMASATGLTGYDAVYLWLAASLGANLITLDRRLATAVERHA